MATKLLSWVSYTLGFPLLIRLELNPINLFTKTGLTFDLESDSRRIRIDLHINPMSMSI